MSTIPTAESRLANTTATTVQQTSNIIKEKIMLVLLRYFQNQNMDNGRKPFITVDKMSPNQRLVIQKEHKSMSFEAVP